MSFNFENYLLQELHSDKVIVMPEQLFAKNGEYDPNKIYVITKYLTSSIEYGVETQPVQILVLSEQNGLQEAKELFDAFTLSHNWRAGTFDNTFVKQQYSSPVVMSNFNEAAYGYRSVLYVSATLFIMGEIADVEDLEINGVPIKPLTFNWSYQMTGNTQPQAGDQIASTVKNISTFQATLAIPVLRTYISDTGFEEDKISGSTVPATQSAGSITVPVLDGYLITAEIIGNGNITNIDQKTGVISYIGDGTGSMKYDYISNNLLTLMLKISAGKLSGNIDLKITFSVFNVDFEFDCKLTALQFVSKPNDAPALQLGLQR